MLTLHEFVDRFDHGISVEDAERNGMVLIPGPIRTKMYLFLALLYSLPTIVGPAAYLGLDIHQAMNRFDEWSARYREFFMNFFENPLMSIFLSVIFLIFIVGAPLFGLFTWRVYLRNLRAKRLSQKGLYQYGVLLSESQMMIRLYDEDDELQEVLVDRKGITHVREVKTVYHPPSRKVPYVTRSLVITWKEGEKSWFYSLRLETLELDEFIKLGRLLEVEPCESDSLFSDSRNG